MYHWEGVAVEAEAGVTPVVTVMPSDGEQLLEVVAAAAGTVH